MEFSLAAEGKVDELRAWLTVNPHRVNLPNTFTNYTLVYTATNHSNRGQKPSISSLQAAAASGGGALSRGSPHLQTIRMLCAEFHADPCIPCGGLGNSCVFAAAELASEDVVQYFFNELDPIQPGDGLAHRYFMKPNGVSESPLEAARRVKASASLIALLSRRAALERQLQTAPVGTIFPARTQTGSAPGLAGGTAVYRDPTCENALDTSGSPRLPCSATNTLKSPQSASVATSASSMRELLKRLAQLRIQDPDSDDDNSSPKQVTQSLPAPANVTSAASYKSHQLNPSKSTSSSTPTVSLYGAGASVPISSAVVGAPPMLKRQEIDISQRSSFANADLHEFRREFGNGFTYIQCRDHYDVRGLLPYTYKSVEYYTPMIFLIYGPDTPPSVTALSSAMASSPLATPSRTISSPSDHFNASAIDDASPGSGPSSRQVSAHSSVASPRTEVGRGPQNDSSRLLVPYCRYRALIDLTNMDTFCINRKAEYVDPLSGAIVPSPCDGLICSSLLTFVRVAVLKNFERIPPMTPLGSRYAFASAAPIALLGTAEDTYVHHHSSNAPKFMRDVMKHYTNTIKCAASASASSSGCTTAGSPGLGPRTRLRHFRICQDLSRFGDGWLRYYATGDFVNGFVPIYREKPRAVMTAVYGVSAASAAAASATSTIGSERGVVPVPPKSTQEVVAMEVALELLVRVQLRFQDTVDGRALPSNLPVCYIVGADAGHPDKALMFECFRPLLVGGDPSSSQARALRADALNPVGARFASGNATLFDLLCHIQTTLASTLEAYAKRYQFAHTSPVNRQSPGPGVLTTSTSSALDEFFATPTSGGNQNNYSPCAGADAPGTYPPNFSSASTVIGTGGVCVVCFVNRTMMVLQPCGHIALCKHCADRLENHNHKGHFLCPVCHGKVTSLEEMYL